MREARCVRGFTVIELLLVATIIGILASIAVPALNRARAASVEASTIGSLRTLVSAQTSYATNCGSGLFAPTIASLSSGTGRSAFVGPEFRADQVDRLGYRIRYTAGPVEPQSPKTCNGLAAGRTRRSYFIEAYPLTRGPAQGTRFFGTGPGITIYQSTRRIAAFYSGVPPAPAKPVS